MRVVFVCQVVDEDDPVQPSTVRWIKALATRPLVSSVRVIALRKGRFELPSAVRVDACARRSRLRTVIRFYQLVFDALKDGVDMFFVHQTGMYPLLLFPIRTVLRKPVFQWIAHPHIGWSARALARWCDDLVFTSTPGGFPASMAKVHVVGQGVDTQRFTSSSNVPKDGLVTVGRIAPVKRLELMFGALEIAKRRRSAPPSLHIYGPSLPQDRPYRGRLDELIDEHDLRPSVVWHGPVRQSELPAILGSYRLFVHCGDGALDRVVVEAMAMELPIVSTNPRVAEALPDDLKQRLIARAEPAALEERIHELLSTDEEEMKRIGRALGLIARRDHEVDSLFDRIVERVVDKSVQAARRGRHAGA